MKEHSIIIVDDHILIANALKESISKFSGFKVIDTYRNGKEFIDALTNENKPKVVLLDVSMPIMDGFETAKWLKENHPEIMIMVLSMQDSDTSLIKMIKNGAKAYLLKNTHHTELEEALNTMLQKGHYFPEWASSKILTSISSELTNDENQVLLSDREVEFLRYSTTEMTYKEIAQKMFCSPRTIENYRDSLFKKLEVRTRVGLAVYAIKNGFTIS